MDIGVVGIGNMGMGIALRLLDGGHAVTVRDLRPEREVLAAAQGATVAPNAAAAARRADLLIVVVVDAAQCVDVLFGDGGAAAALPAGSAVMLCPTIAPTDAERIAQRLAAAGIGCIDAPMSGGPLRARDGTMSLMVACWHALFERYETVLRQISSRLFLVGERPGDGARIKLVNNLLAAINLAGAAEALALAWRVGLDPALAQAVIEQSSGASWIGSDRMPRALAGDLSPRAHVSLLAKDSALALAMAEAGGAHTPLGSAAAARFRLACEAGWADFDDAALYDLARLRPPPPATAG